MPNTVFTMLTHNGTWTIQNAITGEHRTFLVDLFEFKHSNLSEQLALPPPKRVLSLLTGPSNTHDYFPFAFVTLKGIFIWNRLKFDPPSIWQKYAGMLLRLFTEPDFAARYIVTASTRCRMCNRKLTTPESLLSGIGPICEGRE